MDRAEQAWVYYEYREHPKGLYYTCFVDGYRQAEKDLALTWEDASAIVEIAMDIIGEGKIHGEQNIYTEVLKRFKEHRNGKSD